MRSATRFRRTNRTSRSVSSPTRRRAGVDHRQRADTGPRHQPARRRPAAPVDRVRIGDRAVLPPLHRRDLADLRLDVAGPKARSITPMPPSSARTIAIAARVTVSMLAETSGRLSVRCSENRADRSTMSGSRRGSTPSCGVKQEVVERAAANEVEQIHRHSLNSYRRCRQPTSLARARPAACYSRAMPAYAVLTTVSNQPGILFGLTKVLADHQANISYVDIIAPGRDAQIYLEFSVERDRTDRRELGRSPACHARRATPSFSKIYGKRIIIMGGGAQVGQVALGAITEADRHNIRGERISVDTIPLVGEEELASAVRAVVRLPRVRLLVLAGSLMGGDITKAVEEVAAEGPHRHLAEHGGQRAGRRRSGGLRPVQAGVMAVMAIADTAKFDIVRQQKRK